MKKSTEPWLGPIPDHWTMRRVKTLLHQRVEKNHPDEPLLAATQTKGVVRKDQYENRTVLAMKDLHLLKLVRKGDFVISLRSFQGGIEYAREQGIISPAYTVLYPETPEIHGYLAHLFKSRPFVKNLSLYVTGIRQGQNIDYDRLSRSYLPVPPHHEQLLITRYLTHINNRVNRFVRAKRRLIELLEEEKQVVVHQAVTRGLDPDAKMKDSGVEWLGEVPEGWEMRRNATLFVQRNDIGHGHLPILEVSLRTGVRIRDFENSDRKQVMSDREKYKRAVAGDIAYNMMRMWQGAVGVTPVDGLVSPAYVVARPLPGINTAYYESLFRTRVYMKQVDNFSRGIVKDRNRLYWEDFKAIPSPVPPTQEQYAIAEHVRKITRIVQATITRTNDQITLLNEYRTRLISDVVTGKLDVREAAAGLPDVDEDVDAGEEGEVEEVEEMLEEEMG